MTLARFDTLQKRGRESFSKPRVENMTPVPFFRPLLPKKPPPSRSSAPTRKDSRPLFDNGKPDYLHWRGGDGVIGRRGGDRSNTQDGECRLTLALPSRARHADLPSERLQRRRGSTARRLHD